MKRDHREGLEAAQEVFTAAGWATTHEYGGKHLVVTATAPDGTIHRLPITGTPRYGQGASAHYAKTDARKIVRHHGADVKTPRRGG